MKKGYIVGGIVAVVIIAIVVVAFVIKNNSSAPAATDVENHTTRLKTYDACQLLTEEKAKGLLGSAILSDIATPQGSDDLKVTSCTYNNDAGNFRDIISASVLVRSPLTQTGADSNKQTFEDPALVGSTPVKGYGEKATWNATTGQLNILKDSNWLIVSYGHAQPSSHSVDETKKLADILF